MEPIKIILYLFHVIDSIVSKEFLTEHCLCSNNIKITTNTNNIKGTIKKFQYHVHLYKTYECSKKNIFVIIIVYCKCLLAEKVVNNRNIKLKYIEITGGVHLSCILYYSLIFLFASTLANFLTGVLIVKHGVQ